MTFDFRNPDYVPVYHERIERLRRLREQPGSFAILRAYYKMHPWQFVADWGVTYDPRNIERDLPATIPFIPFDRQADLMRWIVASWRGSQDGLVPKSRDTGASWCAIALACTLCIFYPGMAVGFGSRKEEYVDRLDSPKSLFYKARVFMANLPPEFRAGWTREKHAAFMRLTFPGTGSVITGEAGDNIGRGDRTALYFVDESAHLERPQLAEEALSATTNCRIDMSSVKGMANPFATKAHSWPADRIFPMHWRDDPRKDEAWYEKLKATKDATVIAQEYDISYTASVSGVVIPNAWVQAAINAHVKLGFEISGKRTGALDVADEGVDLNAFATRYGVLLDSVEGWSGEGSDIFTTTEKAFRISDDHDVEGFRYDADGLGAGVRGDARTIQERPGQRKLAVSAFRGSAAVVDPDGKIPSIDADDEKDKEERTNKDYFANAKAQAWWHLRLRFQRTFRMVTGVQTYDVDDLISINPNIPELTKLTLELSQPTYSENGAGRLLINKQPDGTKSPNLADAVMIAYAPTEPAKRGFFDV